MSTQNIEMMVLWDKILREAKRVNELCKKHGIKDIYFTTADKGLGPVVKKRGPYNRRRKGSETQAEYEARISR